MRQRRRILAWALAGVLVMGSVPVRAEGNRVVYVSMNGSGENGGMTEDSPLNSIYAAQELLPEGGTILVTDTIHITGERTYLLNDGITLQAADGLEGPVFEIEEGGTLTLNNVVIIGNSSTLISNGGVLKMNDSVSLQVRDGEGVGCVYTAGGAATWLNDELVAGTASDGDQTSGDETETKDTQDATEEDTEEDTEKESEEEPDETEQDVTEKESETEKKQDVTEKESETEKKQDVTEKEPETEKKQDVTEKEPEAEKKQDVTEKESETGKKQDVTEKESETEKKQTETAGASEEASIPIREKAVETVKEAIIALDIHSRKDVKKLLAVSQAYDGLTESEKEAIPVKVRKLLESAKEMAAAYNHTQLGVSVYGNLPWYVQFQVKLTDVGGKRENGLEILLPYELKLWNLYTDSVYTLPEGETVTVTMPVPDVEIDGEFTVFHYKSDGSVETIRPVINGNMMSFETGSFSPFSVAGSTVITGIGLGSGSSSGGNSDISNTGSNENPGSTGTQTPSTGSPGGASETQGASQSSPGVYAAVNTGDDTNVIPAVVTMLAALLAIVAIILHKKKSKH